MAKNLKDLVEKSKSSGQPGLLLSIDFKVVIMMNSLQNIVILGPQGLLMLMVSKFLIKMTRPQKLFLFMLIFCELVIFIKNIGGLEYLK